MKTYAIVKVNGREQYNVVSTVDTITGKRTNTIGYIVYEPSAKQYTYHNSWNVFFTNGHSAKKLRLIADVLEELNRDNPND